MTRVKSYLQQILPFLIYACVNIFFIFKYVPRAGVSPILASFAWLTAVVLTACAYYFFVRKHLKNSDCSEKFFRNINIVLLGLVISVIVIALIKIDPLSVRVDRWSATTYFLDALFSGTYPYAVHTHAAECNFPSPLPLWHYINIPFWLLGDVGYQLIFFLLLTTTTIYWFTCSHRVTTIFLLILFLSPAYWWEVAVRSDGLSNMLLVFCTILFIEKKKICFDNNWLWLILICTAIACTRLSAIIPLALYLFPKYIRAGWKKMILFPILILVFCFIVFAPYIFWDTDSWIFFDRNPFMSQTSTGNGVVLCFFVGVGIIMSLMWKNFADYMLTTGFFMFAFMLVSIICIYITGDLPFFENPQCDISYLSLSLPFVLYCISGNEFFQRTY